MIEVTLKLEKSECEAILSLLNSYIEAMQLHHANHEAQCPDCSPIAEVHGLAKRISAAIPRH